MGFVTDLRRVLRVSGFRRLFGVRLTSQCADGVFQVALASYVLFSPERAPTAGAIAAAFAALLLPFSLLGPFVGVFLDRWSRRRTLIVSNLVRVGVLIVVAVLVGADRIGVWFFLLVLAALSVNRFLLAGLSAALPHVVADDELVMANAVSPTCGTLAYIVGAGIGGGVHAVAGDVTVVGLGALGYGLASLAATTLPFLGPDQRRRVPGTLGKAVVHVVRGLMDGLHNIPRPAALGLAAIGAHRFFYGISTVAAILLFRNYFPSGGAGDLLGLGLVVGASGLGYGVAALVTPIVTRLLRPQAWSCLLLLAAGVLELMPTGLYTRWALIVAGFGLGVASQGVKICTDTLVQLHVADRYRGRVFSLYDMLFNVVFVAAAATAAVVLPASGKSYPVLIGCAAGYLLAAGGYWWLDRARVPGQRLDAAARASTTG